MDKKPNQSVKDFLISLVSKETEIPERTCERVIMWAYKQAKEQTSIVASVELSGFGTLSVSQHKVNKEINKMAENTRKFQSIPSTLQNELNIERMAKKTEYLQTKLRNK